MADEKNESVRRREIESFQSKRRRIVRNDIIIFIEKIISMFDCIGTVRIRR
jgi:hypothetical protein